MGIPVISGFMKRLGRIGKLGLFLVLIGFVGSIVMSSITNPASYDLEPQINGRTVIPNESLINQPIGFIQMRVEAKPSLIGATYSIGIVPSYLTSSVQDEANLENNAVAYERDIEGTVEISYSQMGGTEAFDIVVFSQRSFSMQLFVTYNIATGSFIGLVILVGIGFIVLGLVLSFRRHLGDITRFVDPFASSELGELDERRKRFVNVIRLMAIFLGTYGWMSYISAGGFGSIVVNIIMLPLLIVLLYLSLMMWSRIFDRLRGKSHVKPIYKHSYAPDGDYASERKTAHFVNDGAEEEYAMEQMVARHTSPEPGDANSEICHNCGELVSKSDVLCPFCFIQQ